MDSQSQVHYQSAYQAGKMKLPTAKSRTLLGPEDIMLECRGLKEPLGKELEHILPHTPEYREHGSCKDLCKPLAALTQHQVELSRAKGNLRSSSFRSIQLCQKFTPTVFFLLIFYHIFHSFICQTMAWFLSVTLSVRLWDCFFSTQSTQSHSLQDFFTHFSWASLLIPIFSFSHYYLSYVCFACMYVCASHVCLPGAHGGQRVSWFLELGVVVSYPVGSGMEPRSFARAACMLNDWAISLGLHFYFLIIALHSFNNVYNLWTLTLSQQILFQLGFFFFNF